MGEREERDGKVEEKKSSEGRRGGTKMINDGPLLLRPNESSPLLRSFQMEKEEAGRERERETKSDGKKKRNQFRETFFSPRPRFPSFLLPGGKRHSNEVLNEKASLPLNIRNSFFWRKKKARAFPFIIETSSD